MSCVEARPRRLAALVVSCAAIAVVGCYVDPGYKGRTSREWIKALSSPEPTVRIQAAQALGKILDIQPKAAGVVPALIGVLRDENDGVRMTAATALIAEGVDAEGAVPAIHEALHDSAHANVRAMAAFILGNLGPKAGRDAVEVLKDALADSEPQVRVRVVEALGNIGLPASEALPALVGLARDPVSRVRFATIQALLKIRASSTEILAVTRRALADSSAMVRTEAAYATGSLGPLGAPAVPELVEAMNDVEAQVRAAAAFALGEIGPSARSALPSLRRLLADPTPSVARQASSAIASVEGRAGLPSGRPREPTAQERCAPGARSSERC